MSGLEKKNFFVINVDVYLLSISGNVFNVTFIPLK
jgi:exosome complex RNA-binding protein Rrp42 (RNase PH superfamily)